MLAHYRIAGKLGEGGMGVVWKAVDTHLDREVAIKVLPPELAQDPDRLSRFEREARVLASLNHRNVAAIYGIEHQVTEQGVSPVLVLEYVPGETLAELIKQGPLPLDDALDAAAQIAEGLEAAHEIGIIHRDLKPANVKLTPDGRAKILDFGLAKAFAPEAFDPFSGPSRTDIGNSPTITTGGTRLGAIIGTAAYMCPEQARGKAVDKRADIWSFGCLLFECLAGTPPFPGETATDVLGAILHLEPDWTALPGRDPRAGPRPAPPLPRQGRPQAAARHRRRADRAAGSLGRADLLAQRHFGPRERAGPRAPCRRRSRGGARRPGRGRLENRVAGPRPVARAGARARRDALGSARAPRRLHPACPEGARFARLGGDPGHPRDPRRRRPHRRRARDRDRRPPQGP